MEYISFEDKNIKQEIEKIDKEDKTIRIKFDQNKKDMLFLLGILFAAKKNISAYNISYKDFDEKKSFNKMVYFWTWLDEKPSFEVKNDQEKAFLICSVRNTNINDKESLNELTGFLENIGYQVHYPARDTNQSDTIGYRICLENTKAIAKANTVFANYSDTSMGSMFDLGVTYYLMQKYLNRRFCLLNAKEFGSFKNDYGKRIVEELSNMNMQNTDIRTLEKKL